MRPEDDVHGAGNPVAVLGFGYWHDRLGGRTEVLNQPIRVNGQVFTIVGVAPRDFTGTTFGSGPAVFVPLSFKPRLTPGWDGTANYDDYWLYLFARLKPGVSREQAESALNSVYAGLVEEQAKTIRRETAYVERFLASRLSLHEGSRSMGRDGRQTSVSIHMIATGLVLLIAIANAANLLLARSVERRKDLAVQAALGATRSDIMGQWLTEAFLVAAASGLLGVVLGSWTLNVLVRSMAGDEAPVYHLTSSLEWPVLLFAMGASALTGLLVGLYPAWDAARHSVASALKEDSGASSSRGSARVRKSLVVMQLAVSALLLIATGLFMKSLVNLLQVDLGFRTEKLIAFRISPRLNGYTPEQCRALFERIEEHLAAIPGVRAATSSSVPLIAGNNWGNGLTVEGFPGGPDSDTHSMYNMVGPGFFGRMGIPLVAGRELTERDNKAGPKVALVNETFARHFFGDANAISRKFTPGWGDVIPDIEIIGVVRDTKYSEVKQTSPPLYYLPWRQSDDLGSMSFYIRTELDARQTIIDIKSVMTSLDRDLPVQDLRTMEDQVRRSIRSDRMVLQLTAVFALLATSMAMLGLYGVMAYSVNRRTREIGIRLALGARTGSIRAMVMRELLLILAGGLAIGVPAALLVTRYAEGQLFGVTSRDGTVIAAAVSALALAALAAAYFPARRATRVNPLMALRHE
ncbi:MAG: ABC transporter permease [Bryobacteraceae bacterium]